MGEQLESPQDGDWNLELDGYAARTRGYGIVLAELTKIMVINGRLKLAG